MSALYLLDDHTLLREGLRAVLQAAGHRVVGESADPTQALADLRDLFPSKGAMLGGFVRRIDRLTLEGTPADLIDQPARERVLDLMLRRFDALQPLVDLDAGAA